MESFSMLNTPPIVQMAMVGITIALTFAGRHALMQEETVVSGGSGSSEMKESLGNQMGATAALLILVLICQVFFFLDDLEMVKPLASGMTGLVSFDMFRIGVMIVADIARALALVFLVGASYRVESMGAAKGLLVSATALLFLELVTGKLDMGEAICTQWYNKRKRDQRERSAPAPAPVAPAASAITASSSNNRRGVVAAAADEE